MDSIGADAPGVAGKGGEEECQGEGGEDAPRQQQEGVSNRFDVGSRRMEMGRQRGGAMINKSERRRRRQDAGGQEGGDSDSENGDGSRTGSEDEDDEGELIFLEGNEAAYVKHIYNRESVMLSKKSDHELLASLRLAGRKSESEADPKNESEERKRHSEDEGRSRWNARRPTQSRGPTKPTGSAPSSPLPQPRSWVRAHRRQDSETAAVITPHEPPTLARSISFVRRVQPAAGGLRQADD